MRPRLRDTRSPTVSPAGAPTATPDTVSGTFDGALSTRFTITQNKGGVLRQFKDAQMRGAPALAPGTFVVDLQVTVPGVLGL